MWGTFVQKGTKLKGSCGYLVFFLQVKLSQITAGGYDKLPEETPAVCRLLSLEVVKAYVGILSQIIFSRK